MSGQVVKSLFFLRPAIIRRWCSLSKHHPNTIQNVADSLDFLERILLQLAEICLKCTEEFKIFTEKFSHSSRFCSLEMDFWRALIPWPRDSVVLGWAGLGPCYQIINQMFSAVHTSWNILIWYFKYFNLFFKCFICGLGPCYQIINQMFSAVSTSSIENLRWQSRARLFLKCIVTKVLENGDIMTATINRSSLSLESVFKLVTRHNMYIYGSFLLD